MLVRDVCSLMLDKKIVIVDKDNNELWNDDWYHLAERKDLIELDVVMIKLDWLHDCYKVYVIERHDDFHEIELLLSDCMRYADEGRMIDYVAIMHAARRVAKMAETAIARVNGGWLS